MHLRELEKSKIPSEISLVDQGIILYTKIPINFIEIQSNMEIHMIMQFCQGIML